MGVMIVFPLYLLVAMIADQPKELERLED